MTPPIVEPVDAVSDRIERLKYVFIHLSQDLHRLHEDVHNGVFGELKDQSKILRELLLTSKDLMRAEIEIDRLLQERGDIDPAAQIDFESARKELECKLDRLANALSESEVSRRT